MKPYKALSSTHLLFPTRKGYLLQMLSLTQKQMLAHAKLLVLAMYMYFSPKKITVKSSDKQKWFLMDIREWKFAICKLKHETKHISITCTYKYLWSQDLMVFIFFFLLLIDIVKVFKTSFPSVLICTLPS